MDLEEYRKARLEQLQRIEQLVSSMNAATLFSAIRHQSRQQSDNRSYGVERVAGLAPKLADVETVAPTRQQSDNRSYGVERVAGLAPKLADVEAVAPTGLKLRGIGATTLRAEVAPYPGLKDRPSGIPTDEPRDTDTYLPPGIWI